MIGIVASRARLYGYGFPAPANTYTTTFPAIENPMSDGGVWINGADSFGTPVQVSAAGKVHGTQTGSPPPYDDSQAWLVQNYTTNQEVEITVAKANSSGPNKEVECILHATIVPQFTATYGDTKTDCYELNWNQAGDYLILGRYKMEEIDRIASPPSPANGDRLRVRVTQNGANLDFRCWINDVAKNWTGSGTDVVTYTGNLTHPSGNAFAPGRHPGIGFYRDGGAANNEFWATQFIAREV
jgi:hypothetical protein